MLITYFWEVIAFQGSEGSFTKHQLVIISQNLFIQLITASVMMVRDKFIKNCNWVKWPTQPEPIHVYLKELWVLWFPPGWNTTPLQVYSSAFHRTSLTICRYPFILPGGGRHCEREVFCQRTQHINLARSQTRISQPKVQPSNHYTIVSLKGIIYIF